MLRSLGVAGGVFLGAVLLFGAVTKALDPAAFVAQVRAEGLDFWLPAAMVAFVALAMEAGLGTALLLGLRRLWVLVPAAGLVVFFLFLTGRSYLRAIQGIVDESGCGCFGNLVERSPAAAFWQDLALLLPGLVLAFLWRSVVPGAWPRARLAAVAAATAALLGFAWKSPELPLDDFATRLRPGVALTDLCATTAESRLCLSTVAPEMMSGRHLAVIADLEDPAFGAAVDALNQRALAGEAVWVLSADTAEQQRAFFWPWGPVFRIVEAPQALLKPMYRSLPRAFLVLDGRVIETYREVPGAPGLET